MLLESTEKTILQNEEPKGVKNISCPRKLSNLPSSELPFFCNVKHSLIIQDSGQIFRKEILSFRQHTPTPLIPHASVLPTPLVEICFSSQPLSASLPLYRRASASASVQYYRPI